VLDAGEREAGELLDDRGGALELLSLEGEHRVVALWRAEGGGTSEPVSGDRDEMEETSGGALERQYSRRGGPVASATEMRK
jgi:hypothetical protein